MLAAGYFVKERGSLGSQFEKMKVPHQGSPSVQAVVRTSPDHITAPDHVTARQRSEKGNGQAQKGPCVCSGLALYNSQRPHGLTHLGRGAIKIITPGDYQG